MRQNPIDKNIGINDSMGGGNYSKPMNKMKEFFGARPKITKLSI